MAGRGHVDARSNVAAAAGEWPRSNYRAHVGAAPTPPWLDTDRLHSYLLGRPVMTARDHRQAARRHAGWVADASVDEASNWQRGLRGQIFLGDEAFVARMQARVTPSAHAASEIPKAQRRLPLTLQECLRQSPGQLGQALCRAYRECGITMTAMAKAMGLSVPRVSRLIAAAELEVWR